MEFMRKSESKNFSTTVQTLFGNVLACKLANNGNNLLRWVVLVVTHILIYLQLEISALSDCFYLRFQEYSILKRILFNTNKRYHLKIIFFFYFIAFLAISDNYKHFLKIPIFGPKKGAHYGNLGWKSPFWVF